MNQEIKDYAKDHALEAIKDFIDTYSDWNKDKIPFKKDIEHIYDTLNSGDVTKHINCNIYISNKYPGLFDVKEKYNLIWITHEQLQEMTYPQHQQVLCSLANYLKGCITNETYKNIIVAVAETVVKHAVKYSAEKAMGLR